MDFDGDFNGISWWFNGIYMVILMDFNGDLMGFTWWF